MNRMVTDTAHLYWNAEWQKADGTSPWAMPEPWAVDHASTLAPGSRILDLGAGIGRHALTFADAGHQVQCIDIDEKRVERLRAGGVPFFESRAERNMEKQPPPSRRG